MANLLELICDIIIRKHIPLNMCENYYLQLIESEIFLPELFSNDKIKPHLNFWDK